LANLPVFDMNLREHETSWSQQDLFLPYATQLGGQ